MRISPSRLIRPLLISSLLALPSTALGSLITVSQNVDPKADVILQSYTTGGHTYSDFVLVNQAQLLSESPANDPNGPLSVDRGDHVVGLAKERPTNAEIADNQHNLNLNKILDTEDYGAFGLKLKFDKALHDTTPLHNGPPQLLVFERGKNSDLTIQGLDANGNAIGHSLALMRGVNEQDAGFKINTTEIDKAQSVGYWEVSLNQLGVTSVAGLLVTAKDCNNGPDFKIVGVDTGEHVRQAPEPSSAALGFMAAASLGLFRLRKASRRLWTLFGRM